MSGNTMETIVGVVPSVCCLDMDGILTDFMSAAHEYYEVPYSYSLYPYEYGAWDVIPPNDMGMTTRMFWDGLDEDFWAELPWMHDAKELLTILEETFGAENIYILTCPTLNPSCLAGKYRWIKRYMPDYDRRFLIGPSKHLCANPETLLIDDADHNVRLFREAGGQAILVPRKWNAKHKKDDVAMADFTKELQFVMKGAV